MAFPLRHVCFKFSKETGYTDSHEWSRFRRMSATSRSHYLTHRKEAGGPLSWKEFCSVRRWFVTSEKAKKETDASGLNVNCASLLNGGVLRWAAHEERDARLHQITCFERGEALSVSEFATPYFRPFLDVDAESKGEPEKDTFGVMLARHAQRVLNNFYPELDDVNHVLTAVVLTSPAKKMDTTPKYAMRMEQSQAGLSDVWYKKGFHIIFPHVRMGVCEWRQFLASMLEFCVRHLPRRNPETHSPWLFTLDVDVQPNLRAPFSDKLKRCGMCSRVSQPCKRQRVTVSSDTAIHGFDQFEEGKSALSLVKAMTSPGGRHRNSTSTCEHTDCVDGYIPEHRPYLVYLILFGDGSVDKASTLRAKSVKSFAFAVSSIRCIEATSCLPPFQMYKTAASMDQVLKLARVQAGVIVDADDAGEARATDPGLLAGANKAVKQRISRMKDRVIIADKARIQCMIDHAEQLHPCFKGMMADKAWTNKAGTYCILTCVGDTSRRCLNLKPNEVNLGPHLSLARKRWPGLHRSPRKSYFFFSAKTGTVVQKCWCQCSTTDGRVSEKFCKHFSSTPRKLPAEHCVLLFHKVDETSSGAGSSNSLQFRLGSSKNHAHLKAMLHGKTVYKATPEGIVVPKRNVSQEPLFSFALLGVASNKKYASPLLLLKSDCPVCNSMLESLTIEFANTDRASAVCGVVLFLHGMTEQPHRWPRVLISSLLDHNWAVARVLYHDHFGTVYETAYQICLRLIAFFDTHQVQNLSVVGYSFGGIVAQAVLCEMFRHPPLRIKRTRVLLLSTCVSLPSVQAFGVDPLSVFSSPQVTLMTRGRRAIKAGTQVVRRLQQVNKDDCSHGTQPSVLTRLTDSCLDVLRRVSDLDRGSWLQQLMKQKTNNVDYVTDSFLSKYLRWGITQFAAFSEYMIDCGNKFESCMSKAFARPDTSSPSSAVHIFIFGSENDKFFEPCQFHFQKWLYEMRFPTKAFIEGGTRSKHCLPSLLKTATGNLFLTFLITEGDASNGAHVHDFLIPEELRPL